MVPKHSAAEPPVLLLTSMSRMNRLSRLSITRLLLPAEEIPLLAEGELQGEGLFPEAVVPSVADEVELLLAELLSEVEEKVGEIGTKYVLCLQDLFNNLT